MPCHNLTMTNLLFSKIKPFAFFLSMLALIGLPCFAHAQQKAITFEAYSDAKEVLLNNYFEISFTLKNANGVGFKPPAFKDFTVVAGPNSSTSMQIINGQVSREMGYAFTLQPKKEGTFIIGKASIKANGKTLYSNPLTVKVLKGSTSSANANLKEGKAYVVLEPDKTIAYPGEQILVDYKLYTTVSLDGYDITQEPDYKGFFMKELRRFASRTQREVINGQQVTTKVLRRLALFPQQTGELTIPSAHIQLAMVEDNGRTGFFFSRNIKPIFVATDPVAITIKELPPNAPEDFSGAVGQFEFQASVNRRQVTTDDAVSITMMVSGNGDMKRVQPPPLLLSDSFEIYPPKVIEENVTENQGRLIGRKIIEYLVLPKFPGNYSIQPSFSFFNTETQSFEKITAEPYPLFVKKGTDKHISQPRPQNNDIASNNDIRFIKRETKLEKKGEFFVGSLPFYIAVGLPLFAFIGLFIFRKSKKYSPVLDSAALKTKQANKVALQRLSTANAHLQNNASREFYDEISKASLGYVSDKLGIPLSELSKENVKEKLQSLNISLPLVDDFMKIIQTSEMALFAGMDNAADMQETYDKTIKVIGGIEEEIITG